MQDATIELFEIISAEIALDGGASLVNSLKNYVESPKRIDVLLNKSIGSKKLLTFLERHPTIFQVDRDSLPHFVKLLSDEYCRDIEGSGVAEEASAEHRRESASCLALNEKVIYVLRKRASKIARRQGFGDCKEVPLHWLAKECALLLHYYLRASGCYQAIYSSCEGVYIVGTPSWYKVVLPDFERFLKEGDAFVVMTDGKVCQRQEEPPGGDDNDIQLFSARLQELVHEDGGTHARLSLLLHRNPDLKALLGGRDFLMCVEHHPALFSNLIIAKYETDVELQSVEPNEDSGRMDVDKTGLFSVASSKWGPAMANVMVWACSARSNSSLGVLDPAKITAIDMTASVGGFTLALAKTSFSRVIAVEIDPHRAGLCRQNMIKHSMEGIVDVRNTDAMELLPKLAKELRSSRYPQSIVVIDPPWGGVHYKQERNPIFMGSWALDEVIGKVATNLAPTIVGVRLPVTFEVRSFLEGVARDRNLVFETLVIRKLGPQLFVVLAFGEQESRETA